MVPEQHMACPAGAAPIVAADASAERVRQLAQPTLAQPPSLHRLADYLFGPPASGAKLPLAADLLSHIRYTPLPAILHTVSVDATAAY